MPHKVYEIVAVVGVFVAVLALCPTSTRRQVRAEPSGPLVLYLRGTVPAKPTNIGGVVYGWRDLGSFSPSPPMGAESRGCGTVVAFGQNHKIFSGDELYVRDVLFRVWWNSGVWRASYALSVPSMPEPLAVVPVAAYKVAEGDYHFQDGYYLTTLRAKVDRTLTREQIQRLFFGVEVYHAKIMVATSPTHTSMVVLNPPTDAQLKGQDHDHDGVDDFHELWKTHRNPFLADPEQVTTLEPILPGAKERRWLVERPVLPSARRAIGRVAQTLVLTGERFRHRGDIFVDGSLTLDRTAIYLLSDSSGAPPGIHVSAGGKLHVKGGSTLAAGDAAVGFYVDVERGAEVVLEDSSVHYGGAAVPKANGGCDRYPAVALRGDNARVTRCRFYNSYNALHIKAHGARVEHNKFVNNSLAILAGGLGARIAHNTSIHDIGFLDFGETSGSHQVTANKINASQDWGIRLKHSHAAQRIEDNVITGCNTGIDVDAKAPPSLIRGNSISECQLPIKASAAARQVHTFSENAVQHPQPPPPPR